MGEIFQAKIRFPDRRMETYEFFEVPEGTSKSSLVGPICDAFQAIIWQFKEFAGQLPTAYDIHQCLKITGGPKLANDPFIAISPESDIELEVA